MSRLTLFIFFFNDTATTEIYTLSLHDALPIFGEVGVASRPRDGQRPELSRLDVGRRRSRRRGPEVGVARSEEHTSELQSRLHLVCRLLLEKKNNHTIHPRSTPPYPVQHHTRPD